LSYEVDKQKFASFGAIKKQRILAGLMGVSETYLHWQYTICSYDCTKERKNLQSAN
jgi:hypothetical protein